MKRALLILIGLTLILGCVRGVPSDKPPIHLIRDMHRQPRYNPQSESRFFADSSTMREPVPGTIPHGGIYSDSIYFFGKDSAGNFVQNSPVPVTLQLLKRGQERFNIYCSPCHSRLGDGRGIVVQRGFAPPPSFHSDPFRQLPDGLIFYVISDGLGAMSSYGSQVRVADRWAIISYIRALQLSQNAPLEDVPESMRGSLK
jgi:hypothetical protein